MPLAEVLADEGPKYENWMNSDSTADLRRTFRVRTRAGKSFRSQMEECNETLERTT